MLHWHNDSITRFTIKKKGDGFCKSLWSLNVDIHRAENNHEFYKYHKTISVLLWYHISYFLSIYLLIIKFAHFCMEYMLYYILIVIKIIAYPNVSEYEKIIAYII